MAATAVHPAMNGDKALFPLFTKTQAPHETNTATDIDEHSEQVNGFDGAQDDGQKPTKAGKPRKPRKKQVPGQKTLQEIVNPKAPQNGGEEQTRPKGESTEAHFDEPSPRRSKRRRTSRTDSVEVGNQDEDVEASAAGQRHSSPQVIIPASSPLPSEAAPATAEDKIRTPPKKMLRLKAGGKFSSPVSKKMADDEPPLEAVKKRGRPRKAKELEHPRPMIAVMNYDPELEVGIRINRILAGEERFKKQVKILPKKQSTPRKDASKSSHPFFNLDRRKEQTQQPTQPSPRKASAVTPGKLRRETLNADHQRLTNEQPEVWTSALLRDRLMFKHPGAKEPAWPDKEQLHVRGLAGSDPDSVSSLEEGSALSTRKRKGARRSPPQSESLLARFASQLAAEEDGQMRSDGFQEPHPSLRLPKRSLISGHEIANTISKQLSVTLPDSDPDELCLPDPFQQSLHPALRSIHSRITNVLSAFDEGRGEAAPWTQKYAPLSSSEVLQPARQTTVLKDWLSSLKVTAVDGALKADSKAVSKADPKPKKRKRRHKDDDMDDFLVDSDEEVRDMDELTDPEETPAPSQGRKALNSIVQVAADGVKLSNAVLLSGPHGCGKSAAAYAAAKELGFKVFEISSSERRSGKDVLDKVGDMTENHLVKHHGTEAAEQSLTEEPNVRLDEAFQRDLASGRQGKMASFFKPQSKAKAKTKTTSPKKVVKAKAMEAVQNIIKKPKKDQQQSLILLEEVDILFREDKDFWATVFKLIATSKRPFIMTCNDEDLVPLQAMSLHAILRFTPPPVNLATDYLLLVTAAEGHLLEREAVASLYQSKRCDLRATMSELDLWCQMGVGDPRGGLSWIYQRYPPGSDLDENGRRVRVASSRTYQKGIDSLTEQSSTSEEKLIWAWREHGVDASTALGWQSMPAEGHPGGLRTYSKFADELSASDVYAGALCKPFLDVTQKPMKDKARSHYIEGLPLLQTDEEVDYSFLSVEFLTSSTLLAFKGCDVLSDHDLGVKLDDSIGYTHRNQEHEEELTRHAFACFDPISVPVESALSTVSGLQQSAFDGPLDPIATDIAPYVRSIVHFDLVLADQREALCGGKSSKRARTTRAARSALEGGQRGSTRRERWFAKELDFYAVLRTGGRQWPRMLAVSGDGSGEDRAADEGTPASSAECS